MDPNERIPEPGALWQRIAVGYCEWVNGEWPDDDDLLEARAAAKHIATYVECLQRVSGECPMGCGRTLFLGEGGHVTCSLIGCPRPGAVDELLHCVADPSGERPAVLGLLAAPWAGTTTDPDDDEEGVMDRGGPFYTTVFPRDNPPRTTRLMVEFGADGKLVDGEEPRLERARDQARVEQAEVRRRSVSATRVYEYPLDPGIKVYVETLAAEGVETFESCQGGEGHSMPEPTVRFHGEQGAGFRALAVALEHGLPVLDLRRSWAIIDGEPTGPYWELTFRQKAGS